MGLLKRYRFLPLKLLVSSALIGFILTQIELQRVTTVLASAQFVLLLIAIALIVIERGVFALKWKILLSTKGINIPFSNLFHIYYVSNFLGNFIPSSIGVDVIRAYRLKKYTENLPESISSVFVDKVLSLLALLTLPLVASLVYLNISGDQRMLWLTGFFLAAFCFSMMVVLNARIARQISAVSARIRPAISEQFQTSYNSIRGYIGHKRILLLVYALSLLIQMTRVLGILVLGLALEQSVPAIFYFVFVPMINFIAILPISVAGIGVVEGGFVYFFSQAGMAPSDAFALSILAYVVLVISILPAGILYLLEGTDSKIRLAR